MSAPRRFPPPWSVEEEAGYYVVRDHDGQQLAYIYYEQEPGRRSAAKLLTKDEARRIAANIAKLPRPAARGLSGGLVRPHPLGSHPCGHRRNRHSYRRNPRLV